jgi:hypothetical protein
MPFNYLRLRSTANYMITRYGKLCQLRRSSVDRPCTAAVLQYLPREMDGNLIQFGDRRAIVKVEGLTVPPDHELDRFVDFYGIDHRIVAPPGKLDVAGTIIYWELQIRK